jgi:hypothetical protein
LPENEPANHGQEPEILSLRPSPDGYFENAKNGNDRKDFVDPIRENPPFLYLYVKKGRVKERQRDDDSKNPPYCWVTQSVGRLIPENLSCIQQEKYMSTNHKGPIKQVR